MKKNILFLLLFALLLSACDRLRPQPDQASPTPPSFTPTPSVVAENAPPVALRMASIVSPANGETYPLLATLSVMVAVISDVPFISQDLLVNGDVVEAQRGEEIATVLHWVATAPGAKRLQIRAQTEDGQTLLSEAVEIVISPQPAGFDLMHSLAAGETLNSLAGQFGRAPEEILASNPGLSAAPDAPLPAGILLRIPFRPTLPPDFLTESGSESGNAPSAAALPPFSPPAAPVFDLKAPPVFDKIYYYLSLNSGPWSRVPREGEFLTPSAGFFNLEEALQGVVSAPSEGTLRAQVDAWGWSGGALVYIGRFEKVFTAEPGREPFVILPGELKICDGPAPTCQQGLSQFEEAAFSYGGGERELQWIPPAGASGGLWQVSRFPFGEVCTPEPGGVFQSGSVSADSTQKTFNVSFPKPGTDLYSIPIPQPGGGTNYLPSTSLPQSYYVRVLPVFEGAVKCAPSNTVMLTVDPNRPQVTVQTSTPAPAAPAPPELFDIEIVEFKPIHFPDYTYLNCVQIVENPFFEKKADVVDNWLGGLYKDIPPGSILCPQPYVYKEPSFIEQAGQFLIDALNTISKAYEILKALAVKLVVKAIPLCYAGEFIEAYKDEIDSVCNTAAEVIVQAAMTYVGLPPSIPNYEQLKDTAKGKLTELAVQQLEEQTGLPCIEICEDFIRERVDEIWAAGEELLSNYQPACIDAKDAHNQGFEPLCLPGIIKTQPVPETILQPATVQVRVTRRADVPDSALPNSLLFQTSCRVNITTFAENNAYVGQNIFIGTDYLTGKPLYWQGTPLSADYLFKTDGIGLKLDDFAPGASQDFYFALEPNRGVLPPVMGGGKFWLPGRLKLYQDYLTKTWVSSNWIAHDDWEYYYLGAQLTVNASAYCVTRPNSAQNLAPSSSNVSDTWVEQIPADK